MSEPCAICGFPDSRHRVVDAIVDLLAEGLLLDDVLADYGLTAEQWQTMREEVEAAL